MLIVLTGPGSSGKDTVLVKLLEKYPNLKRVITTTTREKRPGEKEGKDYYFVTEDQFEEKIKNGEFIEYVDFSGDMYGTAKSELEGFSSGQDLIWRIETSRAASVKDIFPEDLWNKILVVYIDVPDWEILEQRMKKRGMNEDKIHQRLRQDKEDFEKYGDKFEHRIFNEEGKLDETIKKIVELI